jgi:hypothetical protein
VVIASIAALMTILAFVVVEGYQIFPKLLNYVWVDKSFILLLSMITTGILTIFEWSVLFPDQQDYSILGYMPVKTTTILRAKITSLVLFIGGFTLAVMLLPTIIFGVILNTHNSIMLGIAQAFTDLIVSLMGCMTVFFLCGTINGLLVTIFPGRLYRLFSLVLQVGFIVLFFVVTILSEEMSGILCQLADNSPESLSKFPHLWFIGLAQRINGKSSLIPSVTNLWAVGLFLFSFCGYVFFMLLSYKNRFDFNTNNNGSGKSFFIGVGRIFNRFFLKHPIQKAVYYFFKNTFFRIAEIRLQIGVYLAIGIGFDLIQVSSYMLYSKNYFRNHGLDLSQLNHRLLFVPSYVLIFVLILGIRIIVSQPQHLKANWAIELGENITKKEYIKGLRKAILFLFIIPLNLILCGIYSSIWGISKGIVHFVFCLTFSLILNEVIYFKYSKFPFACSYYPEREKVYFMWVFRIVGLIMFYKISSKLEEKLFYNFKGTIILILVSAIIILFLRILKKKNLPFLFNEEPEEFMTSLNLMGED